MGAFIERAAYCTIGESGKSERNGKISCSREHNSFKFSHKAFETKQNLQ